MSAPPTLFIGVPTLSLLIEILLTNKEWYLQSEIGLYSRNITGKPFNIATKIEEIFFTLQIKFQLTITNLCSYTIHAHILHHITSKTLNFTSINITKKFIP